VPEAKRKRLHDEVVKTLKAATSAMQSYPVHGSPEWEQMWHLLDDVVAAREVYRRYEQDHSHS